MLAGFIHPSFVGGRRKRALVSVLRPCADECIAPNHHAQTVRFCWMTTTASRRFVEISLISLIGVPAERGVPTKHSTKQNATNPRRAFLGSFFILPSSRSSFPHTRRLRPSLVLQIGFLVVHLARHRLGRSP